MLELDAYVHITSPIRRLVDLLNIMILQDKLGLYKCLLKLRNFMKDGHMIQYRIYKYNYTIRRVQNDCSY